MKKGNIDLETIITGCCNGDRDCQKMLFDRFYGKMLGICYRYADNYEDARDITQEGFIKVFSRINDFDNRGSFEGWMRRIIVNMAIDRFRKKKHQIFSIDKYEGFELKEDEDDAPLESFFSNISAQTIIDEIAKLSPAYRTVFNLYVMEDYSHQEIADELGISVGTSKSNLAKARM